MKRLCLLRHAKSDWSDPSLDDAARPLNKRGRKAADFMASYIVERGCTPDAVLCSTARRAVATVAPLAEKCPDLPVHYRDVLYMAMPETLMEQIRATPADVETLLVVAHNPGMGLLAAALAEDDADAIASEIAEGFPTAALAVFDFDADTWRDLDAGRGRPVFFVRPRQLMPAS